MKAAGIIAAAGIIVASVVAPPLFWQGEGRALPVTRHETLVPVAEVPLDQLAIQSVPLEGTVALTTDGAEAPPTYVPNDSDFDKQWAFDKIQTLEIASGGPEVVVAILDTGIDQQHEDLVGKVVASINLTDSPTASDRHGHGTHVAGIIAATADNGMGITGFAPNSRLLNVKVANDSGMVWPSTVAKGIVWAVNSGAQIINMSLFLPSMSSDLEEAVNYASSKGVVLIAAAGNHVGSIPLYPASHPKVIAVAATDSDGSPWARSNSGDWVDAYAPGVEIYSTLPTNSYGYMSGTSMAAAHASAAAVLTFDTGVLVKCCGNSIPVVIFIKRR